MTSADVQVEVEEILMRLAQIAPRALTLYAHLRGQDVSPRQIAVLRRVRAFWEHQVVIEAKSESRRAAAIRGPWRGAPIIPQYFDSDPNVW